MSSSPISPALLLPRTKLLLKAASKEEGFLRSLRDYAAARDVPAHCVRPRASVSCGPVPSALALTPSGGLPQPEPPHTQARLPFPPDSAPCVPLPGRSAQLPNRPRQQNWNSVWVIG